jgi:simple sugar transport system permease protein
MSVVAGPIQTASGQRVDPLARRRRDVAIALGVLGVLTILLFARAIPSGVHTTFQLSGGTGIHVPSITVPAKAATLVLGILCALLGLAEFLWTTNRRPNLLLGIGIALFTLAFLTWAGKGQEIDTVGLLATSLVEAVPLALGAFSGLICERSGVINIAIEGEFLVAAFLAAMLASLTHHLWIGLLAGAAAGGVVGLILGVFAIKYRADQIIVGIVLDAFALGLTTFFATSLLNTNQQTLNSPSTYLPFGIPALDKLPIVGPGLFDQNIFVYIVIVLLIALQIGLFHSRWGLRVRAVGEHPRAADTVGIRVNSRRMSNVVLGGIVAGIGGASFTIGSVGQFQANMTAGLGFIALAAMIFGGWRPIGAVLAALLFGFCDALQFTVSVLNVPIPPAFLTMIPYLATIVAVAGLVGRVRPPAADGKPYVRE